MNKFQRTREEQRRYISENLHLLEPEDLKELFAAIRQRKTNPNAIKELAARKKQELEELQAQLLDGKNTEQFRRALVEDMEGGVA